MFVLFVFRERENFSTCLVGREMYIFSEKRKGKKVGIKMSENYLHNVTGWERPLLCFTGKKNRRWRVVSN